MANTETVYDGISFTGVLTIVFIVLKLIGTITWSWWWVFAPLWIEAAIFIGIAFVLLFVAAFVGMLD
jgi:hypothetical protein